MSLSKLKQAISSQMPISFSYNKPGKTPGTRIGNPHAVWVMRKNDGTESTKVHLVQTEGVSDSGQALPSFRTFDLDALTDVEVLGDSGKFKISDQYKPEWDGYKFVIAKV